MAINITLSYRSAFSKLLLNTDLIVCILCFDFLRTEVKIIVYNNADFKAELYLVRNITHFRFHFVNFARESQCSSFACCANVLLLPVH